jgi:hypothetical protein
MSKKWALACLLSYLTVSFGYVAADPGFSILTGQRVSLSRPPLWVYSGSWEPSGRALLLVDVLSSKIRRYDLQGRYLGDLSEQSQAAVLSDPTILQKEAHDTYWVEDEDGIFVQLDARFRQIGQRDLLKSVRGPAGELRAVYQWVPLGNSAVLVFGDVVQGSRGFSAFLQVSLDDPEHFQILQEIGLQDPARRYYLLGYPYVAAVDGKPYFLMMKETPYLVRPEASPLRFVRVTEEGRVPLRSPDLPERHGMETTRISFQTLEKAEIPAALYGWKQALYLLMRTPEDGKTLWSLLKIDPASGQVLWDRRIDSPAHHLTVIPGKQFWAFLEKGSVLGPGQQKIDSLLLVPTSEIER